MIKMSHKDLLVTNLQIYKFAKFLVENSYMSQALIFILNF